jgi:hypothetical protein
MPNEDMFTKAMGTTTCYSMITLLREWAERRRERENAAFNNLGN